MNYKVVWTEEAEISLSEVIDYLDKKWYQKQVLTFLEKLNTTVSILRETPLIYPEFGPLKVRRALINKQTSLFLKIEKEDIIILSVRDNKRSPRF
ncbi:type II toxin-antitoxin system RelE/ParE family toxin [Belliella sp. R4-6]|uniref:Type II toxin-antitoxin system RelE/ParE family toxin n=1 Tax=Belliella alkalica TaxID=1730871 RepID=A0ABS9V8U1_9BACT|nr:type II toxin-antitoxin system RelE/ParE family toxin [Belliella alkalica]MCH7412842.1 type II toxin-antitoxin system RelE/ParE family toxin [Belliella alkalica]